MEVDCLRLFEVVAVYDGDTITANIVLGLGIVADSVKVRLYGIDAPEVRGPERPEGLVTRDWLRERILGKTIVGQLMGDDCNDKGKFGRHLANIFENTDSTQSLNQEMVDHGLADPANY